MSRRDELLQIRMQIQPLNARLKAGEQTNCKPNPARRVHQVQPATHARDVPGKIRGALFQKLWPAFRADGLIHGFFGLHEVMPPGQKAWDVTVAALRETLEIGA